LPYLANTIFATLVFKGGIFSSLRLITAKLHGSLGWCTPFCNQGSFFWLGFSSRMWSLCVLYTIKKYCIVIISCDTCPVQLRESKSIVYKYSLIWLGGWYQDFCEAIEILLQWDQHCN
jgi:hypothetical protein